ncbi:MAG: RagB/SusD family nutrient uptake outer membrane protein [Gemmatimonadetes bacterium]|nr:RagB/SusD family nutrient uptake outer membrane protein [Gemmatimonadota bacterium]
MRRYRGRGRRSELGGRARLSPGVALLLSGVTACSSLLDVEAPSRIEAETLEQASNAALLVASAISDFECAFSDYIVAAGLVGDELQDSQLASALWPYDQRQWRAESGGAYASNTCPSLGMYTPLSTSRWQGDNALKWLDTWTDAEVTSRTQLIAQAAAFAGYSHVLMGEAMCSAAFDLGPELTRPQIWQRAEERFTRAIQVADGLGDKDIGNMARVGRARARLNLGKKTEAAADAAVVPESYVKNATYSGTAPRRENTVWTRNIRTGSATIEDDFRGLTDLGVVDPRVRVTAAGISRADNITPLWQQSKYASVSASIPIATGDEAQLIVAEAQGGQAAVAIINRFHARAGIPPFASADAKAIQDHVILERSRELFLESHHLGDKIRYNLPFTPAAGTPYPPKAGGFYGTMTCFPLPDVERLYNPNIKGAS